MDELVAHFAKILSNVVVVHIYSFPNFSIEVFLASVVCVVHCLLIIEVNNVVHRTNAKIAAKLRLRTSLPDLTTSSYHSLSRIQTEISKKFGSARLFTPSYKKMSRKISSNSNLGWIIPPTNDATLQPITESEKDHYDRIEHLLSVTPSEYIRRDKEKKEYNQGLQQCLQSLTSLLHQALVDDQLHLDKRSKDKLRNNLEAIRSNLNLGKSSAHFLIDPIEFSRRPSIDSIATQISTKTGLDAGLKSARLSMLPYDHGNVTYSSSNVDETIFKKYEKMQDKRDAVQRNVSSDDILKIRTESVVLLRSAGDQPSSIRAT